MITRHFIDRNPPPDQNRCFKTIYFDPKSNRRIAAFHIGLSLCTHNYLEHDLLNVLSSPTLTFFKKIYLIIYYTAGPY